jgi:L-2,4-diaminobutyrate decarboxylase
VECTKAALGLKVFFRLAAVGQDGLARYIESQCGRTRRFAELIRRRSGFECPFDPQSNVLCFRYGASNPRQIAIRDALLRDGRYHISSTEVNGECYLRLSVMSPATEDGNIEGLLDEIERMAASLDPPVR